MNKAPQALRIEMLGGFRVRVGSRIVGERGWRLRKAAGLVKLLALSPWHRLHREQAMEYLWPGLEKKAAASNLRQALHAARRTLVPDPIARSTFLSSVDESLVLCPETDLWIDVDAFERAAATARHSGEPATYRAAIDLYAGDLLPNDRYEDWAENRRQQLRQAFLALLTELSGSYERYGERERAIATLQRAISNEPTLEEAHTKLMRLHALSGEGTEAIRQYERLEEILSSELGSQPTASSRALRREIEGGQFPPSPQQGSSNAPATRTSGANMHNLPAPRTSFVGRERQMLEVKRALAMTRLLTLTGAGGSGKTRLATEVARSLVGAYPDGVWLVELAGLSEGTLVPQEAAGVLRVQERAGQALTDTMGEVLQGKRMLLVLDNCEHLVEAAAHLVNGLLDSCPDLRVLATSREVLGVAGEVRWTVPVLSVPDPGSLPKVEELEGYESARLFAQRASERRPDFAIHSGNGAAVAEICRKLDGMPLAIELAATRTGALAVEQISERLTDSLKLLTGGGRTRTPRQRTLRGALDWSHDLLGEEERKLFRRLAVFAGGWTLAAAEVVGAGDGLKESEVIELLSELVDKSLIRAEVVSEDVRYGFLEPVRQYAREKLEGSGEAGMIHRRHAEFFVALAEEAEPRFRGPLEATYSRLLESEHANLRAAFSWSLDGGDPGLGLRLAAALRWFWNARGHLDEGAGRFEKALGVLGGDPVARAGAYYGWGHVLRKQSDFGRAEACFEEALALYEELGDEEHVADALEALGLVAADRGEDARASSLFEQGLAIAHQSGNTAVIPSILSGLAVIALESNDPERAQRLWGEALMFAREHGNVFGIASALMLMGYAELAHGNPKRATALLQEALVVYREIGININVARCLRSLGVAATFQGNPHQAKTLLEESLKSFRELGSRADIAENLDAMAGRAGALGEDLRAARLWGAAEGIREVLGAPWWLTDRLLYEPQLVATRSRLDEMAWETAWAEGKVMGLEEAMDYAFSDEQPATSMSEQSAPAGRPPALTRREREVASLVARGLTNHRIAWTLFVSERTVDHHVSSILKKLGLASREQVASRLEGE